MSCCIRLVFRDHDKMRYILLILRPFVSFLFNVRPRPPSSSWTERQRPLANSPSSSSDSPQMIAVTSLAYPGRPYPFDCVCRQGVTLPHPSTPATAGETRPPPALGHRVGITLICLSMRPKLHMKGPPAEPTMKCHRTYFGGAPHSLVPTSLHAQPAALGPIV